MKKNFQLKAPNHAPARVVEAIKFELRKYVKRERNKPLPEGVDFWDFDCRVGPSADATTVLHVAELNDAVDHAVEDQWGSVYFEILSKPGIRRRKTQQRGD
jgi:hypothetical protein